MRAARLRHIVTVVRPQTVLDRGSARTTYVPYATSRAGIEPLRGNERLQSMQVNAEQTTRIVMRWDPKLELVEADWYIRWRNPVLNKDVYYGIASPPLLTNIAWRELIFMCRSGQDNPQVPNHGNSPAP